jgi:hypothetical protein
VREERRRGVEAVVGEGGAGTAPAPGGRRVRLDSGGRERSAAVAVVDELAVEVCDGGRRVVALERVVTDDLARACRGLSGPWPTLAPDTTRRAVGTPEEVVGLGPAIVAPPDVAGRLEVDG